MKIAVLHNYMDNIGGAERVCLTLARNLKADFYSTNINYDSIKKLGFSDIKIKSIGRVPVNAPYKQQAALARFRYFKPKIKYDYYIIAGDWAVSAAVLNKPNLWYVHSPIREIWDLYKDTRKIVVHPFLRNLFDIWVIYNRYLNKGYINHVDKVVSNSINTKKRVKRYLNRNATVIYPPIDTKKFYYAKTGYFWLSVNRLITFKRVEMQLEAFRELPNEKLIIVGSYEPAKHFKDYVAYLYRIKPDNVEILHWISFEKLRELYSNCKGFICSSTDEDFGMSVIEAMASGKPIIAPNEGGYKETLIDGKTGILIDDMDYNKLVDAISMVGMDPSIYKEVCLAEAKKYDTEIFIKKIRAEIRR